MLIRTYALKGYYQGISEASYYDNFASSFGTGYSEFTLRIDNVNKTFKKLSLVANAETLNSLKSLIENGIAIQLPDLTRTSGNRLLYLAELQNDCGLGYVINTNSGVGRGSLVYSKLKNFDNLDNYFSDGSLNDAGKSIFVEIYRSTMLLDDAKNSYFCYTGGKIPQTDDEFSGFLFFSVNQNDRRVHGEFNAIFNLDFWNNLGNVLYDEKDTEYGELSTSGGYGGGSFDNSSDAFGVPQLPSVGVTSTGFINVYNPSLNQLSGFGDDLFPDIAQPTFDASGTLEAVANNIQAVGEVIKSFADCFINQNLIQYVIDCHIVPCVPSISENSGLKVGFKTFNFNPAIVISDYVTIDCGTLEIAEYYQNFLDYVGTKAKLFLPFVGFVDIKNEWFQGGKLHVVYHYNVIDGSFMSFILATSSKSKLEETVVGSYGGNCCVHIPITGTNYASMISGVVQGTAKAVTSLATANLGGVASYVASAVTARPSIEQSNGYNSNSSYMGIRIPYLLIERPVASFSKNYPHEQGLPLNVTKKLADVKGFTVCENLHVDNIDCTQSEKDMIKALFASGVIL